MKTAKDFALELLESKKQYYKMNSYIETLTKVMDRKVPDSMKYIFAMYGSTVFVGHFRKKIELWKGNDIPANGIFVVLAKSGGGKTSSIKRVNKAFGLGYKLIESARVQVERELAEAAGENPRKLRPLTNALSTGPGLVRVVNEFANEHIGCPNIQVDELVNSISNQREDLKDNIQICSETFDDGDMEAKALKDTERQSDPIKGMGISAIFVGAQNELTKSEKLLEYLIIELETKLFRRATICCPIFEEEEEPQYENYEEVIKDREKRLKDMLYSSMIMEKQSQRIFKHLSSIDKITIHDDAKILLEAIKDDYADAGRVDRIEIHWRVTKLSGVLASLECEQEIKESHVMEALHFAESYLEDWDRFMSVASAQGHEKVINHFNNSDKPLSAHDLKKQKIIRRVEDLSQIVTFVNSSDTPYTLEICNNVLRKKVVKDVPQRNGVGIHTVSYKPIIPVRELMKGLSEEKTKTLVYLSKGNLDFQTLRKGVSKKEAKSIVAKTMAHDGYKTIKVPFSDLGEIIIHDTAYIMFELKDGKRRTENIVGGTSVIVLDIDKGIITDYEAHDMFSDYKHHIARTSDKTNPFKFRVLLEADCIINVSNSEWLQLEEKIAEFLNIEVDILSRAQLFYGYSDRELLTSLEGKRFPVKQMLATLSVKPRVTKKVQTIKEQLAIMKNRKKIFRRLYDYKKGDGLHAILFSCMAQAHHMGLTEEQNEFIIMEALEKIQKPESEGGQNKYPRKGYLKSLAKQRRRMYGND